MTVEHTPRELRGISRASARFARSAALGWSSQLSDLFVGLFIIVAVGTDLLRARARRTT